MTYTEWIEERNAREDSFNNCDAWTRDMLAVFPELKRVRGHVLVPRIGKRPHWWLTAPDGTIVDPTASQFTDVPGDTIQAGPDAGKLRTGYYGGFGMLHYEPLDESQPHPVGRCMNCGGDVYANPYGTSICDEECNKEMLAYLQRERRRYERESVAP